MENMDNKYKKKIPFTVPEGYFDHLPDQIMNRIEKENKVKYRTFLPYIRWVAVFVIGFVGVWTFLGMSSLQKISLFGINLREEKEEIIFDSQFNPTSDEIIEYLVSEVEDYEVLVANVN